ncbi:MAG: [Fe-Fe] hydrogenase large subunit C-terminal domain-containing protein, partial [Salinivirgaceae bacterium]
TVVELVQKYFPEHIHKLTPFLSPAQCHAKLLKERNPKAKVVFAGPCIAKKSELGFPGNDIDAVLTFRELQEMFDGAGVMPELLTDTTTPQFYPFHAGNGRFYPVDGGMSNSLHPGIEQTSCSFMSFSGMSTIKLLLDRLPESPDHPLFLELMACDGGCINGPGRLNEVNVVRARERILVSQNLNSPPTNDDWYAQKVDVNADFCFNNIISVPFFSKGEISETLSSIGKLTPDDELNCGGCGYSTCRAFARAILEGKAERQMCVSYMRKMAQNKASVLLHKMPYGVVTVDDRLKVIESNQLFASIWGENSQLAYNAKPGLEGASIGKLSPLSRLFKNLLESGHERIEKNINHNDRRLHVSLFTIQKHKQVCAIVRVPGEHEEAVDDLVARLRKVVRENMQTAQKAASLIGENAANTECLINTVVDSFTGGADYGKDVY